MENIRANFMVEIALKDDLEVRFKVREKLLNPAIDIFIHNDRLVL